MGHIVHFVAPLELAVLNDSRFKLTRSFLVLLDCSNLIVVPEGFETDLASVPRLPILYLAMGNTGHKAAVLHDWLYSISSHKRSTCDYYFYHALRESGMNYLHAKAMYIGVRLGGWKAYNTYKEKKNGN